MLHKPTPGRAHNGNVSLAYEVFGPSTGTPLLLLMGLGMQMLLWHNDFCREFVARGFQVVRMDNRNVGVSTQLNHLGTPSVVDLIGRPRKAARYSLSDMAADAIAVLDDLGWESANVVGGSLGGMIAQTLALEHPARARSRTSIMSSPSAKVGRASAKLGMKVARELSQPIDSPQRAGQQLLELYALIGIPPANYPLDIDWLKDVGATCFQRAYDPAGKLRQQAAMFAAPDRSRALSTLTLPTLVMHGTLDLLIRPVARARKRK